MAVPDNLSIFMSGWFQTDGLVPNQIEIFTGSWWNTLEQTAFMKIIRAKELDLSEIVSIGEIGLLEITEAQEINTPSISKVKGPV